MSRQKPTKRVGSVYRFQPSGWDRYDARANTPKAGTLVRAIKSPFGCPPFGMMGHGYVADFESGEFLGLVDLHSLQPVEKGPEGQWLARITEGA